MDRSRERKADRKGIKQRRIKRIQLAERKPERGTLGQRKPEHEILGQRKSEHETLGQRKLERGTLEYEELEYRRPRHSRAAYRSPEHRSPEHRSPDHMESGRKELGRKKPQVRKYGTTLTVSQKKLLLTVVVFVFLAGMAGFGIWFHRQAVLKGEEGVNLVFAAPPPDVGKETVPDSRQESESRRQEENFIFSDFQAGAVSLDGLTAEQAEQRLRDAYQWNMQIVNGEDKVPVADLTGEWAAQMLEKIKKSELPAKGSASPDYDAIEEKLKGFAQELGKRWDESPVDSQVESYNRDTKVYSYTEEKNGKTLNQEALVSAIMEAVKEGRMEAEIHPEFTVIPPARTRQQAKEQYRVIGTFETKTTDNKNRNQNIRLAAEAIDGMVIQPGKEFSFNSATGNRTSEKGYQPAGAYKNGVLIEEPGGGVCQVSTTLYHAIIEAGYKTTERNAHSFAPSYVEKGQDAMVSFDGYAGPDLKFVNTGKAAVVLRAAFDGKKLKLSIVGLPVLDEGLKVSIRSEKVSEVNAPEPVYEENPEVPYGTERTIDAGKNGSVWKSYRVISKNGTVLEEKPLHNSYYKPKTALIQKNTQVPSQETASASKNTDGAGISNGMENPNAEGLPNGMENPNAEGLPNGTENPNMAGLPNGTGNPNAADLSNGAENPAVTQ